MGKMFVASSYYCVRILTDYKVLSRVVSIMSLQEVDQEIQERRDELVRLRKGRREILSARKTLPEKMLLFCKGCKRRSILSRWTLIVEHYYVPPRGCTEGAYWSESRSSSRIRCPRCGHETRLYNGDGYSEEKCKMLFGFEARQSFSETEERFDGKTRQELGWPERDWPERDDDLPF